MHTHLSTNIVRSDCGNEFRSVFSQTLARLLGMKWVFSTYYSPATQGLVEVQNRTILSTLRKYVMNNPSKWHLYLNSVAFAMNSNINIATGYSAFMLLHGFPSKTCMDLVLPKPKEKVNKSTQEAIDYWSNQLDIIRESAKLNMNVAQKKMKESYDKNSKKCIFNVNDFVYLRKSAVLPGTDYKLRINYEGPFIIKRFLGPVNVVLQNTTFYIAEDFPSAIISKRRQLYPIYKAAKSLPMYQRKVSMRGEKLVLNGRNFTCQNADEMPKEIHPGKLAQRSNDTTLVFGGSTSSHHVLSNFYNVKNNFVYEHQSFSTAEQAFQHKKARVAGDQNKQREIMFNPDPAVQKNLGHEVRGLDGTSWDEDKCAIMKDILISKFTQHEQLKKYLIDTKDKILAEANGRDDYFAVGLPLTHPDVLNSTKWADNSNHLGRILMEIREELRSEG